MPLKDFIKDRLVSCGEQDSIFDVADLMKNQNVGAIVVVKDRKPVGIVTDRDIVVRAVADKVDLKSPISQIMTKTVESVDHNMGIQDIITRMRDRQVRRIPVVDDDGNAVGLVSFSDIFGLLAKEMAELSRNTAVQAA